MTSTKKPYWFKRHRYGYGWTPSTWQGWMVIGVYLLFLAFLLSALGGITSDNATGGMEAFLFGLILSTFCLFAVTFKTAPPIKWRWGKNPSDNPDEDM